jgi:glycosyltransferase involved in cell wall biosynthesis
VVSEDNRRTGVHYRLFGPENSTLIRSGIRIARFRDCEADGGAMKRSLGIDETAPLVGMIACFKPQKAPLDFVRVAHGVKKSVPRARFILVGDGALRGDIERLIKEKGLEKDLCLTGWRRDIPELLRAMDILVLTSKWEGLPRVFSQARAARRPVVASRVDGAPEAIREGVNGYLLEPGDVAGFTEKIIRLLKDDGLREDMGRRGPEGLEEFDIDLMVKNQEALYRKLLKSKFPALDL